MTFDDEADADSDAAFAAFGVVGPVQVMGFASPPAESLSTPISTFDDTLFLDMSFQTLLSEDSVAKRLRSTSAVKPTYLKKRPKL